MRMIAFLVVIALFFGAGLVDGQLIWPTPTPTGGSVWDTPTPTRTPTNTWPPATVTPRDIPPTSTPTPTMTPTPTPILFICGGVADAAVSSVEGVPFTMEWYFNPGCGKYPLLMGNPDCVGALCKVPLNYPDECVTYLGRYWHEIAPGMSYIDDQHFQIETTCIRVFIFSDGFEGGTTDQWSKTVTN